MQDSDTITLVDQINRASSLGIRVSFGFLDATNSLQDKTVLEAIRNSGGVYATITTEDASNNFINFAILNGLTYNDNPQGDHSTLLAGLSIAEFISGSETQSITYNAQAHESVLFSLESIDAGNLTAKALFGGKVQNGTSTSSSLDFYYGVGTFSVVVPSAGQIEIKVTAQDAPHESTFVIGAISDMPIQNCTLAVGNHSNGGLSAGAKAGLGIGILALVACIAVGCFFLWKYFKPSLPTFQHPPTTQVQDPQSGVNGAEKPSLSPQISPIGPPGAPPPQMPRKPVPTANNPPSDNSQGQDASQHHLKPKFKRFKRSNEERHHHHLISEHPCNDYRCPLVDPQHVCKDPDADPKGPCACTDQNCPLNDPDHESDKHEPACECTDEKCPINEEKEKKKREQLAQSVAVEGAKIAGHLIGGAGS
jgi:hypothetical protein